MNKEFKQGSPQGLVEDAEQQAELGKALQPLLSDDRFIVFGRLANAQISAKTQELVLLETDDPKEFFYKATKLQAEIKALKFIIEMPVMEVEGGLNAEQVLEENK